MLTRSTDLLSRRAYMGHSISSVPVAELASLRPRTTDETDTKETDADEQITYGPTRTGPTSDSKPWRRQALGKDADEEIAYGPSRKGPTTDSNMWRRVEEKDADEQIAYGPSRKGLNSDSNMWR